MGWHAVNDDGLFDISDSVCVFSVLFIMVDPPGPPFPGCGEDPTGDSLTCNTLSSCP